ncbi:MAG: rod shape-determining protein MreC [Candidatus Omnitrophica bacterium]|nr:rod shape-determining protein MreC [Candidatus Omnitrophota bacterium]
MAKFRIRLAVTLLLLVCLSLSLFFLRHLGPIKMGVIETFKPALGAVNNGLSSVKYWGNLIVRYNSCFKENETLKKEIEELTTKLTSLEEARIENERLRGLLSFKENVKINAVASHVIGRDASNWVQTLLLDKGGKNGIKVNSTVVSSGGLVGRVVDVGQTTSRVLLITDPNSRVGGLVQSNRESGVVEGIGNNRCRIKYLPLNSAVKNGDVVITSGISGLVPKGIIIGRVLDVTRDPSGLYMRATIQPQADVQKIEEVLCIE